MRKFYLSAVLALIVLGASMAQAEAQWGRNRGYYYSYPTYNYGYTAPSYSYYYDPGATYYYTPDSSYYYTPSTSYYYTPSYSSYYYQPGYSTYYYSTPGYYYNNGWGWRGRWWR